MYIFKTASDLQNYLTFKNQSIGFVPTMGALHQGHISLISASKIENELTVCSIFVNPTQFNDPSDFEKYPITVSKDIDMLTAAGTDVLFLPSVKEMYPEEKPYSKSYPLGKLDEILEGAKRPGHYNGVCTIVEKLLHAVQPNQLYLGEKDLQQCLIINKLVDILNLKIKVNICPTLREPDGLAMSSRNTRLTPVFREKAVHIFKELSSIKMQSKEGSWNELSNQSINNLEKVGFKTEYLELLTLPQLELGGDIHQTAEQYIVYAGVLDGVRLIDNLKL
ncbi:MAG: pantoate--beta-alanine ligase [Chitinophagaceae bacterium]|nr:pantoate--beta-alanine ligase [Chitinophagaceae bacterium]